MLFNDISTATVNNLMIGVFRFSADCQNPPDGPRNEPVKVFIRFFTAYLDLFAGAWVLLK